MFGCEDMRTGRDRARFLLFLIPLAGAHIAVDTAKHKWYASKRP